MAPLHVYCDGSITNADLRGPYESCMTEVFVGRVMVLVPERDVGYIAQRREGLLTKRGTPDSVRVEELAILAALEFTGRHALGEVAVFSDCQGAIERVRDPRVQWASREQLYLPNAFFDKVLGRASYLRQTAGRVRQRRKEEPHQREVFELFNAPEREFRLMSSPLWARVQRDVRRHTTALTGVDR